MFFRDRGRFPRAESEINLNWAKELARRLHLEDALKRAWIIKCLEENLPIFLHNNAICYSENGKNECIHVAKTEIFMNQIAQHAKTYPGLLSTLASKSKQSKETNSF